MKLVVVGSVALDDVESPSGKQEGVLGGSATYFSVSSSFFTKVHLVAVVGEDFPEKHIQFLKERGVNLEGLEVAKGGKTFRWSGVYKAGNLNEAITLDTQLNVFAKFKPKLPESYQDAELLFLANIDPELQMEVLAQVKKPKFIACDTMNLWIENKPKELQKLFPKIDLLMINDGEAKQLSGVDNIIRAAREIHQMGVENLCIKRGEYGALFFRGDEIFHVPAYPLEQIEDPTGAGDTFAGGFMGSLSSFQDLSEGTLRRALVHGSVMASFTVEAFSLQRLRILHENEIMDRFQAFKAMTHF